ncbi:hypothetical protein CDV36_011663 [Fusarium kuroshium]|uniref:Protein kinase domain-containing protein n=1 Tax=Fusarium kuroshium TaxID=2010991 RepID=A0A3M2RTT1_9HYPO|nr:hypothetical protein CDV36_011663 [Fusarium kuroshium]
MEEELERLREELRQYEEKQRQHEEKQRQHEEEQRQHEEKQRQHKEEQRQHEEKQRQHKEEQRQHEEKQRQHEEEQRQYEEKQRQREEAEDRADASRPSTLQAYLETCHSLSLDVKLITDRSLTTQGDTANPIRRICPRRIIPWDIFAREQEHVWDELSFNPSFFSQAAFPSRHQLDYVRSLLHPVRSEFGLQNSERVVVEHAVQKLMDATYNDLSLRGHLGLDGTVTFKIHTNPSITDDSLSESTKQVSIGSGPHSRLTRRRRKARGKGNGEDEFCIYRASGGQDVPAVAIQYKAPHELRRDAIVTGLASEIQPDRDVINQEGEGYEFASRRLVTAVVTQLFSYMIGKGIQYGYIDTGEVYVFLHIPDDPSCVYYSVCVPSIDAQGDDSTRLHRTAVAQVFAFVLQAIRSPPPCQAWHDAAEHLDTWAVEYEDVLWSIPATDREPRREIPYKAQQWTISTGIKSSEMQEHDGSAASQEGPHVRPNIQERPYCTQECLRRLAFGGPMDQKCPNLADHGNMHITLGEFLRLARDQLAVDRGKDADCVPLYLSGSRGSLFKFRLSSHGYTLVVKGVEGMDTEHLLHESKIYSHLRDLQGEFVPVCLGVIDLTTPYYFDSGVYEDFMFLSYGGRPVLKELKEVNPDVVNEILAALGRIHQHGVLHRDAEPRNVLYDKRTGRCMMVDLMLSEVHARQPLGPISVNRQDQKKRLASGKHEKDVFAAEAQCLRALLTR